MDIYSNLMVFVFGAIIGSFLNVVLYRMHTGRSVNGRSHCMSCGETLRWYELFPVFSYLFLRARCAYCSAYIPLRYLALEIATGCAFLSVFQFSGGNIPLTLFYFVLTSFLLLIVVYDIRHTIIPDEFTVGVGVLALIYVVTEGITTTASLAILVPSLGAGLGAGGFFFLLWYASKGRWLGLGDAKLALPLGMIAGPVAVVSMVVLAFWTGALISLVLLACKRLIEAGKTNLRFPFPRLTIHSEVPFAPFLILGFLLVHFFHADIFVLTSEILSRFLG